MKKLMIYQVEAGKISFGVNYNGQKQELRKAAENALQSYEDGIYSGFVNDEELGEINSKVNLKENDVLTFVRLTMLAGRMWCIKIKRRSTMIINYSIPDKLKNSYRMKLSKEKENLNPESRKIY